MHTLYNDAKAPRPDGSYRVILINSSWHVVANGYLCKVADAEEGPQITETSKTLTKERPLDR